MLSPGVVTRNDAVRSVDLAGVRLRGLFGLGCERYVHIYGELVLALRIVVVMATP